MNVGIHLPNYHALLDDDKQLLLAMQPGAATIKLMSYHGTEVWAWCKANVQMEMPIVRFVDWDDWANLMQLYGAGYRWILEAWNEPNHPVEGFDGIQDFCVKYDRLVEFSRRDMPQCPIAFPGLSPRHDDARWLDDDRIQERIKSADYLAAHCYYQTPEQLFDAEFGMRFTHYHERFPDKQILISEMCCTAGESGALRPKTQLAAEYVEYAQRVAPYGYVQSVIYFLLNSTSEWVRYGETFDMGMAQAIGGNIMEDPRIAQLLAQNALLTEAFKAFRQGKFTGADGIDGIIVALTGQPLTFTPSYPPKNA